MLFNFIWRKTGVLHIVVQECLRSDFASYFIAVIYCREWRRVCC